MSEKIMSRSELVGAITAKTDVAAPKVDAVVKELEAAILGQPEGHFQRSISDFENAALAKILLIMKTQSQFDAPRFFSFPIPLETLDLTTFGVAAVPVSGRRSVVARLRRCGAGIGVFRLSPGRPGLFSI